MESCAKRLRSLRESVGISQEKLAAELGTSQSSLNRYENGQSTPSVALFRRYADYFDVSLDYIFGRTDNPQGQTYCFHPKLKPQQEEIRRFLDVCFEPGTPANAKLKDSLYRIMEEQS